MENSNFRAENVLCKESLGKATMILGAQGDYTHTVAST